MNPPIRKLPKSVTSLICASNQINGYLKAVQELVFNSLDANATAIAVRIHIPEGSIQVIDNGTGISQNDLKSIGDNYMTSKVVDISTLKSTPDKYGYQGQSLANLIQISGILKVASRFHTSETTWAKLFKNGKARYTTKCNQRPSKGTTVEIKGFLYNLRIRRKSVDVINDLQSIKVFLEYVSLVHSSISISLRDDSKNEIVYQIHKNRDIFQTISTLYGINKSNIQELQVEKKQYKLKAYIGKHEAENLRQLIFINGRAVPDSSRIQIKVNCALKKHFGGGNKKIKKHFHFQRVNNDEEEQLFTSCYPFYLIFITCPHIEYEFNTTVLEFKDWEQINKLLEKLIQFYAGAIQLKEPNKNYTKEPSGKEGTESTRNKVKKIMEKILGSHCRKPEISNMQNGIKGKMIKRNIQPKKTTLKLSKVIDVKKKLDNKMHTKQDFINTDLLNENQTTRKSGFKLPPRRGKTQSSKTLNRIKKSINPKIAKEPDQKCIINKNEKQNSKSFSKKLNLNSMFAMDSVKKICELQEEKAEKNINKSKRKPEMYLDKNVLHTQCNFIKDNRNLSIHKKVQELVIHEYIPKYNAENQIDDNRNKKSFISTYDLLQTIINSQFSHINQQEKPINNLNSSFYPCISGPKRNYMPSNKERCFKSSFQQKEHSYDFMQSVFESDYISPLYVPDRNYEHFERDQEGLSVLIPDQTFTAPFTYTDPFNVTSKDSENFKSPLPEFTNNCHNINFIQQTDTTSEVVTFQSHQYYEHNVDKNSNNHHGCNNKPRNFITTNSRNNFLVRSKVIEKNLRKKRIGYSRAVRGNKYKLNTNKTAKLSNNDNIEKSYTIEFTERNVYNSFKSHFYRNVTHYPTLNIDTNIGSMIPSINNIYSGSNQSISTNTWLMTKNNNIMQNPSIQNRKTSLHTSPNMLSHDHNQISFNNETGNYHETYTIENLHESNSQNVTNNHSESNVKNYVFVSHENNENQQILNPIDMCETILRNVELTTEKEKEFDKSFNYNLDYSNTCKDIVTKSREVEELEKEFNFTNNNIDLCILSDKNASNNLAPSQTTPDKNDFEEISHHFTISKNIIPELRNDGLRILNNKNVTNGNNEDVIAIVDSTDINEENYMGAFNMKNRLFFVPKGMSPIFKEGQTKSNCQYDFNEEYYEDKIYNDFMCKLQNDVEILKPRIDEANEVTTNDITKVNSKLNKTKASLKFDGQSIKTVKVLGQVDKKFIAAIIKGKTDIEEFLVLFDQHAVHERIRLENNLADYLSESQWKSVTIDEFSLKMSRDEILYLHNYKEKFAQFGLQWTILSYEEISINAIPEGILGKNPRQVDKIIKAVKNLIKEEIYNLQMQRGCVSLYPKCIMDLVFNEACRYAIKFGEHLTKSRCVELLNDLSDCKTPFQCAHGRPAMAVIMNIESNETKYKVDINKIPNLKTKM